MARKIVMLIMAGIFVLGVHGRASAEEAEGPKTVTLEKSVSGEVSGISKNFIGVIYAVDPKRGAYELAFPLEKGVKVDHKRSLSEIGVGDMVTVYYDEIIQKDTDGKTVAAKRVAKTVEFLRQAPPVAKETAVLDTSEEPQAPAEPEE